MYNRICEGMYDNLKMHNGILLFMNRFGENVKKNIKLEEKNDRLIQKYRV